MVRILFDATPYTDTLYGPVPTGEYLAVIEDSRMKESKTGKGKYIEFVFKILGPTHKGRKVFERINLIHENAHVVAIAHQQLAALCHAAGKMKIKDSQELHFQEMIIRIGVEGTRDKPVNVVKGYKHKRYGFATERKDKTQGVNLEDILPNHSSLNEKSGSEQGELAL